MGVRILAGVYDGGPEKALLVDSVTERPLPLPMFESEEDAENFLQWFIKDHGDPRKTLAAVLELAHTLWLKKRCPECFEWECSCFKLDTEEDRP